MNKYLVIGKIEGEDMEPVIKTAPEIFDMMDLDDCYDIQIDLHKVDTRIEHCTFLGSWCCTNPYTGKIDRLRMEIRAENGTVLDVGYGTDH